MSTLGLMIIYSSPSSNNTQLLISKLSLDKILLFFYSKILAYIIHKFSSYPSSNGLKLS